MFAVPQMQALAERLEGVERTVDEQAAAAAAERERELRAVLEEEIRSVREAERAAEGRARRAEDEAALAARSSAAAEQRWRAMEKQLEDENSSLRAECEVLSSEVERHRSEVLGLRREREMARRQEDVDVEGSETLSDVKTLNEKLSVRVNLLEEEAHRHVELIGGLEREASRWKETCERLKLDLRASDKRLSDMREQMDRELAEHRAAIGARVDPTKYQQVQREARMLRRILYGQDLSAGEDEGGTDDEDDAGSVVSEDEASEPVAGSSRRRRRNLTESALKRVRLLEDSLLQNRRKLDQERADASRLREELRSSSEREADLRREVKKLEEEALVVSKTTKLSVSEQTLELIVAKPASEAAPGQGLSSVLRSQRDRFRAQVGELEGQVASLKSALERTTLQQERLETDNVALWGAIRLVRADPHLSDADIAARLGRPRPAMTGVGAGTPHSEASLREAMEGRSIVQRYSGLFDEQTDPFGGSGASLAAARRERELSLNTADVCVLQAIRACASSSGVRAGISLYLIGLHVLVMTVLWLFAHSCH
jgi:chromosome segregation ATPase